MAISKTLIKNAWTEEARKKALEARRRKSGGSWLKTAGKAGLIGAGVVAGGLIGLRTGPRLLGKGRAMKAGESLMGKVLYSHQGLTTPAEIIRLRGGKSLEQVLRRASKKPGLKGKIARAGRKVDEFFGIPQRHYGVGLGSGRVADITKAHSKRVSPLERFGKNVRIVDEGKLLKKKGVVPRELESKLMDKGQVAAFEKRYADRQGWRGRDICLLGDKNCETYARGIAGLRPVNTQARAMKIGAGVGAGVGGAGTAGALGLRKKMKTKKEEVRNMLQIINEWSDEARAAALETRRRKAELKGKAKKKSLGPWDQSNKAHDTGASALSPYSHSRAILQHGTARASHLRASKSASSKAKQLHLQAIEHHRALGAKHKEASKAISKSAGRHMFRGAAGGAAVGAVIGRALLGKGGGFVGAMAGLEPGLIAGTSIDSLRRKGKVVDQGVPDAKKSKTLDYFMKGSGAVGLGLAAAVAGHKLKGMNQAAKFINPARYRKIVDAIYKYSRRGGRFKGSSKFYAKDLGKRSANWARKKASRPLKGELMPKEPWVTRLGLPGPPTRNQVRNMLQVINGGPGSGHHGHEGIPGQRGGSMPADGSAPKTGLAVRAPSLPLSESPQNIERRRKAAFSKSSKLGEVFSSYADELEQKRRKKLTPLNKSQLLDLAEAHDQAHSYLRASAEQATLVKGGASKEEQKDRLRRAAIHQAKALKYATRAKRRRSTGELLGKLGKATAEGVMGGSLDQVITKTGRKIGAAGRDTALEAIKSGVLKAKREREEALAPSKAEFERAKQYHGMARVAVETKAKKLAKEKDLSAKDILRSFGRGAGGTIKARASEAKKSWIEPKPEPEISADRWSQIQAIMARRDQDEALLRQLGIGKSGKVLKTTIPPIGNQVQNLLTTITANLSGQVRKETLHDREYLVAPLTMIVPGVLAGSKGPLLYPEDEVRKNPSAWNGMPIVVNHPTKNGIPVEARSPDVLERHQIGTVFNTKFNGKLVAEGWFDLERTRRTNIGIYEQLVNNQPIELSTGLYTDNEAFKGTWNGRRYEYVARNYRPDHLAILLGSKGACSIKDGCGVLINKWSDEARQASIEARRKKTLSIEASTKANTSRRNDLLHKEAGRLTRDAEQAYREVGDKSIFLGKLTNRIRAGRLAKLAAEHERVASGGLLKSTIKQRKKTHKVGKAAKYGGSVGKRIAKRVVTDVVVPVAGTAASLYLAKKIRDKYGSPTANVVQDFKRVHNNLVRLEIEELVANVWSDEARQKSVEARKKWGKRIGGGVLGAGGAWAGMKAGALAGTAAAPFVGPLAPLAPIAGGAIGAATGGYLSGRLAKKLGGKHAEQGSRVGEMAGLVGGGIAARGVGKLATRYGGKSIGSLMARVSTRAGARAGARAAASPVLTKTGKAARLARDTATDWGTYLPTRHLLESSGKKRQAAVRNAWTEAARQKSIETRQRNAMSGADYAKAGGAIGAGYIAARVAGRVIGRPISKEIEPLTDKAAEVVKKKVARSFAKGPKKPVMDVWKMAGKAPPEFKPGLGRKVISLLSKLKRVRIK